MIRLRSHIAGLFVNGIGHLGSREEFETRVAYLSEGRE